MLRLVVRSKRDRDAVRAALESFYPEWGLGVETLQGARSSSGIAEKVEELVKEEPYSFYVVLLGREDREAARELEKNYVLPPNVVVHVTSRKKVRNHRLEQLAREILFARSLFRQPAGWDEEHRVYLFGLRMGEPLEGYTPSIYNDPFLALGKASKKLLDRLLGGDTGYPALIVRGEKGIHTVYTGRRVAGQLLVEDYARRPGAVRVAGVEPVYTSVERIVEANRPVLELYEKISIEFLKRHAEQYDTVVVPWSGGKDSTAVLILALKALGRKKLRVVFTDTGTEFPQTHSYIEKVAEKLGVEVHRAYAGVDKGLLEEGMPMPSHDNRWCTGRKIEATHRAIREVAEGKTLILVGDREAESPRRAARPPQYIDQWGYPTLSPIRLWGAVHVQLYLLANNVPLNPLYLQGFYRVGCYMCPALRSWEVYALTTNTSLYLRLARYPVFREFIRRRYYSKNPEGEPPEQ